MGKKSAFFKRLFCFGGSEDVKELKSEKILDDSSSSDSRDYVSEKNKDLPKYEISPDYDLPIEKAPLTTPSPCHYGVKLSFPHRKDKDPADPKVFWNRCKQKNYRADYMVWIVKKGEILEQRQSNAKESTKQRTWAKLYDHVRESKLSKQRGVRIWACAEDIPPNCYDEKVVKEAGRLTYIFTEIDESLHKIHTRPNDKDVMVQCHDVTFKLTAVPSEAADRTHELIFKLDCDGHTCATLLLDTSKTMALFEDKKEPVLLS